MSTQEEPDFDEEISFEGLGIKLPPPDAPLIEVAQVPNGEPTYNRQFNKHYSPAQVATTRGLIASCLGSPEFLEAVGRVPTESEAGDILYGYSEIQANA